MNYFDFFIFSSISKSTIIKQSILINSFKITFCIRLLYPILDLNSDGRDIYLSSIILILLQILLSFLIAFIKLSIYINHFKFSYIYK